ncbi:MAG: hypothetical protein A2504_14755 [Bdellovibrionales bacterium RIFOXYD12_FULL_39_22]|nr:MAG: hypothetical protein A2385_10220 [Bdellovibrionales bacterium RIFOXYB1_FULL_39_21]OFZ40837.1 MAG: hypothetical protein A2485_17380 [Bdellovibrionales bacterium RIFOXYC12_FULL_39_17]OFZ44378.1 MAG: hypothetical protein A2404_10990 [Bdellovibrionales bacterium RIFOXYC1_FULL_39_130]OFZ74125.1 MAG: hypothetical protein A2560_03655 [Bdellovibrionales bacterium RIFOXYD1_FULL_39_84]OFZ91974.1 MAG: hypothetical protein A2504_14755 [Bdellovibrionales bacterium RIFOXYD12_FULL_39_22]HLE12291.1 hy
MKALIFVFLVLVSSTFINSAFATPVSCIGNLTYNFSVDSVAYSINLDQTEVRSFGSDHLANSIQIIKALLQMKECEKTDVNFMKTPLGRNSYSRCRQILDNNDNSRACFVESSIGYFFVTWDFLSRAHVIYNRWD